MRVATIDIGTNTALLLVADVEGGRLVPVHDEERFVRLGEGVDAARRLSPTAMDRAVAALRDYRATADRLGAPVVTVGATSASRDAANLDDLRERVRREAGLGYEVISGEEEARWSFRGACSAFPKLNRACVIDVGGGSTELVAGPTGGDPAFRVSLDVGSVRVTERCFPALPPPPETVAAAEAMVAEALAPVELSGDVPLLGASGTAVALARLAQPDAPAVPIPAGEVRAWRERLLGLTAEEVRALDPVMAGRADVFAAGVLIVDAVMRRFGFSALHPSPRGLRHGLALRWVEEQGGRAA